MNTLLRVSILQLSIILAGCGGGGGVQPSVLLGKSVENTQCEPPKTTLRQLDLEALAAGLELRSTSCAWDGLSQIAACGAGSRYIRTIEIPEDQIDTARAIGYRSPAEFYMFIRSDCLGME